MHASSQNDDELLEKVALFGVALLIVAVAIAVVNPPAERYEISIYGAYPFYFWVCLVGAMLVGSLVILGSAVRSSGRSWMFGLYLMLVSNAVLLLLPFARGYYMYVRGDPLSHLGFTQDIINVGEPVRNVYPPMHLLALAIGEATGFELTTVAMFVPFVFSMLYFGAMFYLLYYLFESRRRVLFGLPFVMLPILRYTHPEFRPFGMSIMLIPLVFYLFIKGQRTSVARVRVALVVTLIAMFLYHPLTALFVTGIFALWFTVRHIPEIHVDRPTPTNVVSISAVVFLGWYSNYGGVIRRFRRIYETLFGTDGGTSPADGYAQTAETASPPVIDLIRVATFRLGLEAVLFTIGFVFIGVAAYLIYRGDYLPRIYTVVFSGTLVVFSFGGLAFLLMDLIVPHTRPFHIAKVCAVILIGQLLYLSWDRIEWTRYRSELRTGAGVFVVIALLLLIGLSMVGVHHSPIESESNQQVTEMTFESDRWITEHGTATDSLLQLSINHRRLQHAQYGARTNERHFSRENTMTPPNHFAYGERPYLGAGYSDDQYLLIGHRIRIFYQEVHPNYPENWRFTPAGFERLERDNTVDRTYDNGDHTQYLVEGTGEDPTTAEDEQLND